MRGNHLQIIWEVEIANHSEEDYYFKLMSYIETALLSQARLGQKIKNTIFSREKMVFF
jgi:hypothetical protein